MNRSVSIVGASELPLIFEKIFEISVDREQNDNEKKRMKHFSIEMYQRNSSFTIHTFLSWNNIKEAYIDVMFMSN